MYGLLSAFLCCGTALAQQQQHTVEVIPFGDVYKRQVDQNAINNEINKYRSELAQAQADLANAKNALEMCIRDREKGVQTERNSGGYHLQSQFRTGFEGDSGI